MEIERKFLIHENIIYNLKLWKFNKIDIMQGYVAMDDNEVRVRKVITDSRVNCFMSIKSKGNVVRKEIEFPLPHSTFNKLIEMKKGNTIEKSRYLVPLENGEVAELDIYKGKLLGLYTVEVEFESQEQAKAFVPPKWFGKEITFDKRYKNRNLALKGFEMVC